MLLFGVGPSASRNSFAMLMDGRLMAGEESVRLDVEHETGRGALHPPLGILDRRDAVVAGVDLHDGKLRCVEAQPIFWRGCYWRIELPAFDERFVCPR